MNDRGVYRGVYSTMVDDTDYQALSPPARHVLLTLRVCPQNNAASLFRVYPAVLQAQTGYGLAKLERALSALEAGRWIERDGPLVWIRNGLRFDPNLRLADPKHRKAVVKAIAAYSKSPLLAKFCEYYEIACPSEGHSNGLRRPIGDMGAIFPPSRVRVESEESPSRRTTLSGWRPTARRLLDFLNEKTGRTYQPVPANLTLIEARLKEGATEANVRGVIARKVREWHGDPKMSDYLRPKTLFNATNFAQYLGQREAVDGELPPV